MSEHPGPGEIEVFYADPVDKDGNVIGRTELKITHSPFPTKVVKVPASEIVLDPESTIHVDLTEKRRSA